jgi:hypothetical protein
LRYRERLGTVYLPLIHKVCLIPDDDDGNIFVVLDANNFIAKSNQLLERGARGDAEDQEESLSSFHVQIPHSD